jgi:hypothetical protein
VQGEVVLPLYALFNNFEFKCPLNTYTYMDLNFLRHDMTLILVPFRMYFINHRFTPLFFFSEYIVDNQTFVLLITIVPLFDLPIIYSTEQSKFFKKLERKYEHRYISRCTSWTIYHVNYPFFFCLEVSDDFRRNARGII